MQTVSLLDLYYHRLDKYGLSKDSKQIQIIQALQSLYDQLSRQNKPHNNQLSKWFAKLRKSPASPAVKGIYLWGNVGCGKTFLLDLFFEHIPLEKKQRLHFHRFMNEIHTQLNKIKDQSDPLAVIAETWGENTRLLYLDEFYVADIGDAMIIAELIKNLFAQGITLIASSNCHPGNLYANGLQRQRFLPTIDLITQHMEIIHLDSSCDYRLRLLTQKGLYNILSEQTAETTMAESFEQLATTAPIQNGFLNINGRNVQTIRNSGNIAWFNFNDICGDTRATQDYLEIAHCYQMIMVSGIPVFYEQDDLARRFINMIDTFYDNHVIFICSAETQAHQLYKKGRLALDFQRTASRLAEMHSRSYLTQGHLIAHEKTN